MLSYITNHAPAMPRYPMIAVKIYRIARHREKGMFCRASCVCTLLFGSVQRRVSLRETKVLAASGHGCEERLTEILVSFVLWEIELCI